MLNKPIFTIIIFLLVLTSSLNAQNKNEFETHFESIDKTYRPGFHTDKHDSIINTNRAFLDYTIEHLIDKPEDKYFISNRNILEKFRYSKCDSMQITISDTVNHKRISINIKIKPFIPKQHHIVFDSINQYMIIDGNQGWYGYPETVIESFSIIIDNKELIIPNQAYKDLYDLNICDYRGFMRGIEAYKSLDNQYTYLYLYGGVAAGTYFCKLAFDKDAYITRIYSDYIPLSIHGLFGEDFIGF